MKLKTEIIRIQSWQVLFIKFSFISQKFKIKVLVLSLVIQKIFLLLLMKKLELILTLSVFKDFSTEKKIFILVARRFFNCDEISARGKKHLNYYKDSQRTAKEGNELNKSQSTNQNTETLLRPRASDETQTICFRDYFCLVLLRSVIGQENLRHPFNQSGSILKPIKTSTLLFSRALRSSLASAYMLFNFLVFAFFPSDHVLSGSRHYR